MAVTVVVKETGQTITGKFLVTEGEKINLYTGIMADKKGGFRGCGKKLVFDALAVTMTVDDPQKEMKQR